MIFIKALRRQSFILTLAALAVVSVAACAKLKEDQNIQKTSFSDAQNEEEVFEEKETFKKPLYPTVIDTSVKHGDQVVQSPDGKSKLLLHSFTIKNSSAQFNKDSQKMKFTGTADFDSFRNLGKYDFDLRGQITKGHAVLYPLQSADGDRPKIFAIVVCNRYDSKTHPTCDSFFIDVYFKFSKFGDELFDEQVTDCGASDSCLNLKENLPKPSTSPVTSPPIERPVEVSAETPAEPEPESAVAESEEQDDNFTPGGYAAYNQPDNVENLLAVAEHAGEPIAANPSPKIDPKENAKKAHATILEFPFNVDYPTEGSPQQVDGTQIGGHLIKGTELVEPSKSEVQTFFIDDNSKNIQHPEKKKTFGTFYAVDFIKKLAEFTFNTFRVPLRINDLSYREGGYMRPHDWHRIGLDVDIEYNNFRMKHEMTNDEKWILFQVIAVSPLVNQILVSPETKMAVMKLASAHGDNDFKTKEALRKLHAECDHPTHFHINFICGYNHACDQNEPGLSKRYAINENDTYASLEKISRKCEDQARARSLRK